MQNKKSYNRIENTRNNNYRLMGLLQLAVTWYMLEGKLPSGTSKTKRLHQNKFEFSLFGCPSGELALQHVPCDR